MRTKKVTASLIVVFLSVAMFFSIGALADQSYYYDYKIKGSNVNLRTTPEIYGGNNVLGLVQNGELINVYSWHQGIDNSYSWGYGLMATGGNAGKEGYVAEPYLTPNN